MRYSVCELFVQSCHYHYSALVAAAHTDYIMFLIMSLEIPMDKININSVGIIVVIVFVPVVSRPKKQKWVQ